MRIPSIFSLVTLLVPLATAQLELAPEEEPQCVFWGEARTVRAVFKSRSDQPQDVNLRTRLYQASSATLMPMDAARPWKRLRVLPGQSVMESVALAFPSVRAATRFQVHWLDDQGAVVGRTEVRAYPTNLLQALGERAGEEAVGVMDPGGVIEPLLTGLQIRVEELRGEERLEEFRGQVVIVGSFASERDAPPGLARAIETRAKRPGVTVWIQPPSRGPGEPKPTLSVLRLRPGTVVLLEAKAVADLAHSALAQARLLRAVEMGFLPDAQLLGQIQP